MFIFIRGIVFKPLLFIPIKGTETKVTYMYNYM